MGREAFPGLALAVNLLNSVNSGYLKTGEVLSILEESLFSLFHVSRTGPSGCLEKELLTPVFSYQRLTPMPPKFLISFHLSLLSQRFLALHPPTFHCGWSEA